MDNKRSHLPKVVVDLKQLPPIDPFRIMNSSYMSKLINSSSKATVAKVLKPSPSRGMKLVDYDKSIVKNTTSKNVDIDYPSSIFPNKKNANTTSPTQIDSADEGMKKGSPRSNLYEICAANHWKSPVFECYKEEGPCHQRMFTFKVIIEIEEASKDIIECYGAPHRTKKTAADNAAEGALWSRRRRMKRRVPWRKPLKLSYCAYRYYIVLFSKHEHCVWCNNCPWLLEHIGICNTASWVAAHNLSCSDRFVMELNMTTRMDNPEKHGL